MNAPGTTSIVATARRLVIKVGSTLVTDEGRGIDHAAVGRWAEQIAALAKRGKELVLVSSGAIVEGMKRLGWTRRPVAIHELQAAAAVGQMGLVQAYETAFKRFGLHTAQILLTHEDMSDRRRYLNEVAAAERHSCFFPKCRARPRRDLIRPHDATGRGKGKRVDLLFPRLQ